MSTNVTHYEYRGHRRRPRRRQNPYRLQQNAENWNRRPESELFRRRVKLRGRGEHSTHGLSPVLDGVA